MDLGLRRDFQFGFTLANISRPIIGADFLHKYGLLVDIRNKSLVDPLTNLKVSTCLQLCSIQLPRIFAYEDQYTNLLKEFPSLTSEPDYTKPVKHSTVHKIVTNGTLPYTKPRRLDHMKYKVAKSEFEYLVKCGVCRPSDSSVASALHLVPKKDPND